MNTDSLPPSYFCCLLQVDGGDSNELKPQCGWGYNLRGQDIRVRWPRWFADLQHCESGPSWETSSSLEFFFFLKKSALGWGHSPVIYCLSSIQKTLGSIPSTTQTKSLNPAIAAHRLSPEGPGCHLHHLEFSSREPMHTRKRCM